ncbi:T9SS type A sorting domain-containing protein [Candidatus Poribacteria bacterium]|nr:T9SS type A sorting domain-containing protein [Candidatus Poribacteria bacterium]
MKPDTWGKIKNTQLFQNYPNPCNPGTWIPFQLGDDNIVSISIFDVKGSHIRTLNLGPKRAGSYLSKKQTAYWDGKNEAGEKVPSGIYFYTIQAGDFTATKRMVVER